MGVESKKDTSEVVGTSGEGCEKVQVETLGDINKTIEPLTKEQLEENIGKIHDIFNLERNKLNDLRVGINEQGEEREVLDTFIDFLGLEKNEGNRLGVYNRLSILNGDNLKRTFKELKLSDEEVEDKTAKAYEFTTNYHMNLHEKLIEDIEKNNLLTPFYLEILKQTHNVGLKFNDFQKVWQKELIDGINKRLEKRISSDKGEVIDYLKRNFLMDKGHNGIEADRSYSVLKEFDLNSVEGEASCYPEYEKLAYVDAFPKEINSIVEGLCAFIKGLEKHEDDIYDEKEIYINYLESLKVAFLEKRTDRLVKKWSEVDEAWMKIEGPFQIGHPFEYYEDKYRKAVAPEWNIRLKNNNLFESKVEKNMVSMFNERFKEFGIENHKEVYNFSMKSLSNVGLYISSLLMYHGSSLIGNISAQVIPNDTEVSEKYGKKIFAFPEKILELEKTRPITKMATSTFEEELFKKTLDISSNETDYYKIYDIETNGHEFGHTLWLDGDSEVIMNDGGNFKNIEEFKATCGGVIAFLSNPDEQVFDKWLLQHIKRSITLMGRSDVPDVESYYCEGQIHLKVLFDSGIIFINEDKRIELNMSDETLEAFKKGYFEIYSKLVKTYLNKENADNFLLDYVVKEGDKFLPKDEEIREYVKYYIEQHKKLSKEIDKDYIK